MDSINAAGRAAGSDLDSIIDTGTTLVIGDMDTVAALYAEIPGSADASDTAGPGFFTCESPSTARERGSNSTSPVRHRS